MQSGNLWGGSFEINRVTTQQLTAIQQSWLLGPPDPNQNKSKPKLFKWVIWSAVILFFIIVIPVIIVKLSPKHKSQPPLPDNYTVAIHKALMFFDAQKSGRLPKNNRVSWRGDSGLNDGLPEVKGGLIGGYYDAGDNIKFHFPLAFSMTLLSWSVIEYNHKYKSIGEYDHVRDIIKWGTDYLLLTFNSSTTNINQIYSQVGTGRNGSIKPDDRYCWMRPEDMNYPRPILTVDAGPDLAGEMASALAAASIVFQDDQPYSKKLIKGATTLYEFARNKGKRAPYSRGDISTELYYNSTGYYDEYMWSGGWLFYATGNTSYLSLATDYKVAEISKAFLGIADLRVFNWDNKLPAAELLLTRLRIFLNPGYPYEDMLHRYHDTTSINMCSYQKGFKTFNYTEGGLIQLNHGRPQNLQDVVNSVFLASLYADYMDAADVSGYFCGPNIFSVDKLQQFATSQMDYILGDNPKKMSYVVGYGSNYPRHLHHRGASIPDDGEKYSCTAGWKWRDTSKPNPNELIGAMVGGPNMYDKFIDSTKNGNYTEPTMAGNAGLVAALISLTSSGGDGIDRNSIFSLVSSLYPVAPPPPPPWQP